MAEAGMLAETMIMNGGLHVVPVAIPLHDWSVTPAQEQVTVGVPLKVHPERKSFRNGVLNAGLIGGEETGIFSACSNCRLYGDLSLRYVAKARDSE